MMNKVHYFFPTFQMTYNSFVIMKRAMVLLYYTVFAGAVLLMYILLPRLLHIFSPGAGTRLIRYMMGKAGIFIHTFPQVSLQDPRTPGSWSPDCAAVDQAVGGAGDRP